ncbi:hypothetical protein STRDD11_00583 [Streptococcus sp. DD11]|nr:hypothetical protein STRDD11_00583 [Streptococcus sp. DD11]
MGVCPTALSASSKQRYGREWSSLFICSLSISAEALGRFPAVFYLSAPEQQAIICKHFSLKA